MRRAPWLALLALPALAAAVDPPVTAPALGSGKIAFANQRLTPTDNNVSLDECRSGTASPEARQTLRVKWAIVWETGKSVANLQGGGSYQVYASDQADNTTVTTGACPQSDGDKGVTSLHAGPVTDRITTNLTDPSQEVVLDASVLSTVAGLGACNTASTDVMLCVQARDASGNHIGTAREKVIVATTAPAAPTGVGASPGDRALNVSWTAPEGSPAAEYYVIDATPVGTLDTSGVRQSPAVTATSYRLDGLVNGEAYRLVVRAYSTADNASPASAEYTATAEEVLEFWDSYRAAGGVETGGCSAGVAGPLALGALALALARARRRR